MKLSMPLKLAGRELRQAWRHFLIFILCLILGVTVMATIGNVGAMVSSALRGEAKALLGGDVEIVLRGVEANKEQREFLSRYGDMSYVSTLRAMLHQGDESTLVELKAVDANYPLIGEVLLDKGSLQDVVESNGIAVDPILLSQIGLKIGDKVQIGTAEFVVRATLQKEPDRAVQIFNFGPRVMLSHESLKQTGLASTFSLVENRYRILTPPHVTVNQAFEDQLEDTLQKRFPEASWRVNSGTDGNRALQRFMDQLLAFLTLSGLATFLIAGIGIGSSVRAYLEKKAQTIAVLKVQGATRQTVLCTYMLVLAVLAVVGGVAGAALASLISASLYPLISSLLPVLEGKAAIYPGQMLLAMWYGVLITFLFSMPALLSSLNVRPAILFRTRAGIFRFRMDRTVRQVMVALGFLLFWTLYFSANDKSFILGALAVVVLAFLLFAACAWLVRFVARRVTVRKPWLRLALGNLYRPGSTTGTVIFAIGISLTVLIALTLTEANFQHRIQKVAQEEAPSLFMIDIQPDQKEGLQTLLRQYTDVKHIMLYPMIRGRITALNGKPVVESEVDDEVRWAVRGDRGLSYSVAPPPNANIIEGKWWLQDYAGKPLLSVDERFLDGMGLKLGDTITLNVLGEEITAEITSARDIDYTTFQMNFAMMLSPGVLEEFPQTFLSTVHLSDNREKEAELVKKIGKEFPGVTIVRTSEIVSLVREIMEYIALALRITVGVSLLAGLLVLISALSATIEQRLYDTAVLKVLGARQSDILKICTAEWMLLAMVTSLIAAGLGTLSAWLILQRFRGQEFFPMPEVTLMTIAACVVVIWITGYIGNRRLFRFRPAGLLRNE